MVKRKKKVSMKKKRRSFTKKKEGIKEAPLKEPAYVIQVNNPKMLRKDLLESLREVIIFMQGYEKFKCIQDEKIKLFTQLKAETKELNLLIEHKLTKYLPKGKLKLAAEEKKEKVTEIQEPEQEEMVEEEKEVIMPPVRVPVVRGQPSELEELENQLREIESQLQGIQ